MGIMDGVWIRAREGAIHDARTNSIRRLLAAATLRDASDCRSPSAQIAKTAAAIAGHVIRSRLRAADSDQRRSSEFEVLHRALIASPDSTLQILRQALICRHGEPIGIPARTGYL